MKTKTVKWCTGVFIPKEAEQLQDFQNTINPFASYKNRYSYSFSDIICEAMEQHNNLYFDYRHRGVILPMTGKIHYYDEVYNKLHIIDTTGRARYIDAENIVYLEILQDE